jgi:hypothetical protein
MNRTEHMRSLRGEGQTLAAIGALYGVSRQRVFQLIGSTGRPRRRHPRVEVRPRPRWTAERLKAELGDWVERHEGETITYTTFNKAGSYTLRAAVEGLGGFPYWRRRLGQRLTRPRPSDVGRWFEERAMEALRARGFTAERMPWRAPYDIRVNGLRIDVKGASHPMRGAWWFNLPSLSRDVVLAGCGDSPVRWLVIPPDALGSGKGLAVRTDLGTWAPYEKPWRYLNGESEGC